jgi:hypothetical protein
MHRGNLNDLLAFLAVGQDRSFARATAELAGSNRAQGQYILCYLPASGSNTVSRFAWDTFAAQAGPQDRQVH